jgi:DNA topoisomerase-1
VEGSDDPEAALGDREVLLPALKEGDAVALKKLEAQSHETKPPARYTEASLVQALEKEGIGRPSTYAAIIGTILERNYVKKVGNALVPTFTGFAVVQFLEKYFQELVDYGFTSQMEEYLDEVAEGKKEWLPYLEDFYLGKGGLKTQIEKGEKEIDPDSSRSIQLNHLPGVEVRVGRFGPYVVREGSGKEAEEEKASIPEDILPGDLSLEKMHDLIDTQQKGPQSLGKHPATGEDVFCLTGRYGPYVQLGQGEGKKKPKRVSVPKSIDPKAITFEQALQLLSLPRELGRHPESGEPILANLGRFGPYVVHQKDYRSLKKGDDLFAVDLKRALELFAEEKRGRGSAKLLRDLGTHPEDQKPVGIYEGKYGAYVKHGATNVSLPKDKNANELTLPEAVELLAAKKTKKKRK